jgi:hypothetical protein
MVNRRTPSMEAAGCKPCGLEMQGVAVTVTDAAGAIATATLTTR